jgi:C4-dicarboxylate-specific signal transduction histidine kinase
MVEPQKTILVVDDTAVDAAMVVGALKNHFKTVVATSGERALTIAKGAHKPDLILLDVMMAGLDGHEVCRRLKGNPITRDVPVIFLTAKTDVEDEQIGFELGAVDYIHKPFSAPIVHARVSTHLALQGALKRSHDLAAQLLHANEDLERKIAAALERDRVSQAELARATRVTTMGVLTASIAHEINQPITAIVANSSAAKHWLSSTPPNLDEARTALEAIAADGHRAGQVISSLKSMFKNDDRGRTSVVVNDILAEVVALLRAAILKSAVVVRTNFLEQMPRVVGDRTQLQQVFINLITNAIDAMESVLDRQRTLTIRSTTENGQVIIAVEDSGKGIASKDFDHIFDPFFTSKPSGMGIGLSICRSIIESHNGRLSAARAVPYGSIFQVELPAIGQTVKTSM